MAAFLAAVGAPGGNASWAGFAHQSHAPAAALPCRPRAAPAAQALGAYQDHLVIASATGLMNPGHPRPPGTIALMRFPGEQVPGHAACQLDQRRRRSRLVPRPEASM